MTHLAAQRSRPIKHRGRRIVDHWTPLVKLMDANPWCDHIDGILEARSGRTNPIPTALLFAVIGVLGHTGRAYQHEHAHDVLMHLPDRWIEHFDLPRIPKPKRVARATNNSYYVDISYSQVCRKFHAIVDVISAATAWGGLDGFTSRLLRASVPEEVRNIRTFGIDGTPIPVWAKRRKSNLLAEDPNVDWGWHVKGDVETLGYQMMVAVATDPLGASSPYIVAITLAPGNESEKTQSIGLLKQLGRSHPTVDLVAADRGITDAPDVHELVREMHGNMLQQLTEFQQKDIGDVGDSGFVRFMDRALAPGANVAALVCNADGEKMFPTEPPRRRHASSDQDYLQRLSGWFGQWNLVRAFQARVVSRDHLTGEQRLASPGKDPGRTLNCCPTCGPTRHDLPHGQARNPDLPGPPCCTQKTVTATPDMWRLNSWQPFHYGDPDWYFLYHNLRNRNEGVVADVRVNMHLRGGRNDVRVRGLNIYGLLAAVLTAARNLQIAQVLTASSNRPRKRQTARLFELDPGDLKRLERRLAARAAARDALERELAAERGAGPP